jgi:hypothetical protein
VVASLVLRPLSGSAANKAQRPSPKHVSVQVEDATARVQIYAIIIFLRGCSFCTSSSKNTLFVSFS